VSGTGWRHSVLCAALAVVGACAPTQSRAPALAEPGSLTGTETFAGFPATEWPSQAWWRVYGDAQLTALIERGLAGAPSLDIAGARMRRADAFTQVEQSNSGVQAEASGSLASVRQSLNTGFPDAFKDFLPQGWNSQGVASLRIDRQIDFFGANRARLRSARAEAEAAIAEYAAARLELSSAIARAYADLSRLEADKAAGVSIVALRARSLDLVRQRYDAGLENKGSLDQARSEHAGARADVNKIDGDLARVRHRIAALLGEGPDFGRAIARPGDVRMSAAGAPERLDVNLLGRRPDIVAARLGAEAAAARVGAARAAYYPNINLSAVVGLQSLGMDVFAEGDSRFGQVGPAVSLPIFSSGRLDGAYRAARADYDLAVALYNQALSEAMRETADALTQKRAASDELALRRQALAGAEDAYEISRLRYEGGLSRYSEVLTVETRLVEQRRAVADLEAQIFAFDVDLVRALGGGYAEAGDREDDHG